MKKLKKLLAGALSLCIAGSCAGAFAAQTSAAQDVGGLFISEVCFNPNYEGLSSKTSSNNDYFEFVEVKNVSSSAIDLSDSSLYYSKEGLNGSTWFKLAFVYDSSNDKKIDAGETWVIGVYTINTPDLGLAYASQSELQSYWKAFNNYYGSSVSAANRVLAVAAESGNAAWLKGATSLPNTGSAGAIKIGSTTLCFGSIGYAPDTYSADGYALQTKYSNGSTNIIGIAGPTPGTINYMQMSDSRSSASGSSVSIAALNVCYSINNVTPASGSTSDYTVEKREKRALEWLQKSDLDIICLSEIDALWWSDINSTLSSKYTLSGNYSCYGLTDGAAHERKTDSYNPIYYSTSKYEKLSEGHFWLLEESPSVGNKICNWVLLKNKSDSTIFCIFNTHLSANDSTSTDTAVTFKNRYTEEQRLAKLVKQTISSLKSTYRSQVSSIPYIITGDFNINEGSPLYRTTLSDCGVSDSKYIARSSSTSATFNNWGNYTVNNGTIIDFCLVSDGVDCQTYNAKNVTGSDGYLASDHAVVRANLTVTQNAGTGGFDISDLFNFDFSSIVSWFTAIVNIISSVVKAISQIISSLT